MVDRTIKPTMKGPAPVSSKGGNFGRSKLTLLYSAYYGVLFHLYINYLSVDWAYMGFHLHIDYLNIYLYFVEFLLFSNIVTNDLDVR